MPARSIDALNVIDNFADGWPMAVLVPDVANLEAA